ncbi:MAG TPA: deiodinase-like protein [Terriglobales bacterium]|nr:deiodinase-like protein [Terriglobales bacterium]
MFGFGPRYNYERFTREMLTPEKFADAFDDAPGPGDRAPDFEARTLTGDRVRLSDFRGDKNVVLIFGSATCPMTAGSIGGINQLAAELRGGDLEFLFVYVREAHPGEKLRAHRDSDDKICAAELFREEEEIEMPVLVDDVRGTIHKQYGKLPNPAFLIDRSGRIAFRLLWAQPGPLAAAIDELLERQEERDVDHVIVQGGEDRSMPMTYPLFHSYRALERGGELAKEHFRDALGVRGRIAMAASRIAEPVAENIGPLAVAAAITGAVLAGGLVAGVQLRKRRLRKAQEPYRFPAMPAKPRTMTGTDYDPVGI